MGNKIPFPHFAKLYYSIFVMILEGKRGRTPAYLFMDSKIPCWFLSLDLVQKELHTSTGLSGLNTFHRIHILLSSSFGQQLFLSCSGKADIKGREDPFLREAPVQMDLHIAGAFELLKDDIIHSASSINQGCSHDREASAIFDAAAAPKNRLGAVKHWNPVRLRAPFRSAGRLYCRHVQGG